MASDRTTRSVGRAGLSINSERQIQPLTQTVQSVAGLGVLGCAALAHKSPLVQKACERTQRARLVQPAAVTTHGAHIRRILEGRATAFEGVAKTIGGHDGVGFKLECCGHGVWVAIEKIKRD